MGCPQICIKFLTDEDRHRSQSWAHILVHTWSIASFMGLINTFEWNSPLSNSSHSSNKCHLRRFDFWIYSCCFNCRKQIWCNESGWSWCHSSCWRALIWPIQETNKCWCWVSHFFYTTPVVSNGNANGFSIHLVNAFHFS